jgi:hypothetical protein
VCVWERERARKVHSPYALPTPPPFALSPLPPPPFTPSPLPPSPFPLPSELDIKFQDPTKCDLTKQAGRYAELLQACADRKDVCKSFETW